MAASDSPSTSGGDVVAEVKHVQCDPVCCAHCVVFEMILVFAFAAFDLAGSVYLSVS